MKFDRGDRGSNVSSSSSASSGSAAAAVGVDCLVGDWGGRGAIAMDSLHGQEMWTLGKL